MASPPDLPQRHHARPRFCRLEAIVTAATLAPPPHRYARLGVLPWTVEAAPADAVDHDPRSGYVETFWLPVLGPSTTLLVRRLAERFDASPTGFELDSAAMGVDLGLGSKVSGRSGIVRTLDRCVTFKLAEFRGDILHVRRRLPTLSLRQTRKLSPRLRELHSGWIDAAMPQQHAVVLRASHIARSLLALGESPGAVEHQLQQWNFAPPVTWHAVRQAGSSQTQTSAQEPTATSS